MAPSLFRKPILHHYTDLTPDDGPGPNKERKGGTPYAFYPRSWTISFTNPENMNWRNE